jgi:mediator of RNA polymerase II transcription subunit 14
MWFWIPERSAGHGTGTQLAGVGVGSVEAVAATTAAVDAAVAAGTLPRVDVLYTAADENDSSSGVIAATAAVPALDASPAPAPAAGKDGGAPTSPPEVETTELTFDTATVDVRRLLEDGMRAAATARLNAALKAVAKPCKQAGLTVTFDPDAVNDLGENEDGWGIARRPAIVANLGASGSYVVSISCSKRSGKLSLCGAGGLVSPAVAAAAAARLLKSGVDAIQPLLEKMRRAAFERDLRDAIAAEGMRPHETPRAILASDDVWPSDLAERPLAALVPISPSSGGLYVGVFVGSEDEKGKPGKTSFALIQTKRPNAASKPRVVSCAALDATSGSILPSKKRKAGDTGAAQGTAKTYEAFDVAHAARVVKSAVEKETVTAQRTAAAAWLKRRATRFGDSRLVGGDAAASGLSCPVIAFAVKDATAELELRGADGVSIVVRALGPFEGCAVAKEKENEGEPAPAGASGGGAASAEPENDGSAVVTAAYPASDFAVGAALADAYRTIASLAFARAMKGTSSSITVEIEPFSVVIARGKGKDATRARVGWVGAPGPGGRLIAAAAGAQGSMTPETEAALSEAARAGDVDAFARALEGAGK